MVRKLGITALLGVAIAGSTAWGAGSAAAAPGDQPVPCSTIQTGNTVTITCNNPNSADAGASYLVICQDGRVHFKYAVPVGKRSALVEWAHCGQSPVIFQWATGGLPPELQPMKIPGA